MLETQSFQSQIHNTQAFNCGNPTLTNYLKQYASQDQKRGYARTFVLVDSSTGDVLGYYSLAGYGVEVIQAQSYLKNPPYSQVPAMLLGRLAIDKQHQGKKYAKRLLVDAIERYLAIRSHMGTTGIIVDAIDQNAVQFYTHFGFKPIPGTNDRMVLTDKLIVTLARNWALQPKTIQ